MTTVDSSLQLQRAAKLERSARLIAIGIPFEIAFSVFYLFVFPDLWEIGVLLIVGGLASIETVLRFRRTAQRIRAREAGTEIPPARNVLKIVSTLMTMAFLCVMGYFMAGVTGAIVVAVLFAVLIGFGMDDDRPAAPVERHLAAVMTEESCA